MKSLAKHLLKQIGRIASIQRLVRRLVPLILGNQGVWFSRVSAVEFPLGVREEIGKQMDEIPSEVSTDERRFLYKFFSTVWSGKNDVIEVGPFLGGTSCAIAMGMRANPKASGDHKLYTFDRFTGYYDLSRLRQYLIPLVETGRLSEADLMRMGRSAEFLDVFRKIHSGRDYSETIVPMSLSLPGGPEDSQGERLPLATTIGRPTDAVFVDGCKSWFGTKYFMREVSGLARPGTYFLFQDYAWYTCFWIPSFLWLLRDHFEIYSYVRTTYTFVLTHPLNAATIQERFPDKPSDVGFDQFKLIFDSLVEDAKLRNDLFAAARHIMHKAAALAYLGHKQEAKKILIGLKGEPWAVDHSNLITSALRSPTYSPEGEILLDA